METRVKQVAVVGAGIIGSSWALVYARAGCQVRVFTRRVEHRRELPDLLRGSAERARSVTPEVEVAAIMGRISLATTLTEAVSGASWVQESIPEDRAVKEALFSELDSLAPADAILASSTSSIGASLFTRELAGRARCLVVHPATPPHLLPVVEVVPTPWTPADVVAEAFAFQRLVGQCPVLVRREQPGFVMNRLQGALLNEMFRVVADGVMSPEDVDTLIRDGFGLRWAFLGPLAGIDLNAGGGIRDYLSRYGFMFNDLARARGADAPTVTPEVTEALADAMRAHTPLDQLRARAQWRDRAIAALRELRRAVVPPASQ